MKLKKDWKKLVASIGKIVVAVVLVVGIIPAIFMVRVKDSLNTPSYCATCHEDPHYLTWGEADSEVLVHAHYESSISCQTCHDRTLEQSIQEVKNYNEDYLRNAGFGERIGALLNLFDDDINESVFLLQTKVDDQLCTNCHSDDNARITATQNLTVPQNELGSEFMAKLVENGNESLANQAPEPFNPHTYGVDMVNTDDPHGENAPLPECQSCHLMHEEMVEFDFCFSCHHTRTLIPCAACHGEEGPPDQ